MSEQEYVVGIALVFLFLGAAQSLEEIYKLLPPGHGGKLAAAVLLLIGAVLLFLGRRMSR